MPEEYVLFFPAIPFYSSGKYDHQLVVSTSSNHNATVNASYYHWNGSTLNCKLSHSFTLSLWDEQKQQRLAFERLCTNNNPEENNGPTNLSHIDVAYPQTAALKVSSDDRISIYGYQYFKGVGEHMDGVYVMPTSQSGERHLVVTPPTRTTESPVPLQEQNMKFVHITASKDNTTVTIKLKAGQCDNATVQDDQDPGVRTVNVTLHELRTWTCHDDTDLTGVEVESDKPVAVSSGVVRGALEGGSLCCADHVWALLPPIDSWGTEYVTFPNAPEIASNVTDVYHIVAAEKNTTVRVDCNSTIRFKNALAWVALNTDNRSEGIVSDPDLHTLDTGRFHHIVSDKPIMVTKTARLEPAACMVALTDRRRWSTILTFPMPNVTRWFKSGNGYMFFMTVMAEASQKDNIRINGVKLQDNWTETEEGEAPDSTTKCPSQRRGNCTCPCKPVPVKLTPAERKEQEEAVAAIVEEIKANLTLPKSNLSATVRKRTSAPDARASSAFIGVTLVIVFSLALGLPVVLDLARLVTWLYSKYSSAKREATAAVAQAPTSG
ncbi:uncharacterized protein [Littorina saxatilis]|uniref:uncharacterized protein n=1 Tax=Littorina saxatilis TaxID=31220 RepID=UPI0038B66642